MIELYCQVWEELPLERCFSKQWALDQCLSISWALARNATPKPPPQQPYRIRNSGAMPNNLNTPPPIIRMHATVREPQCWNDDSRTWQHIRTPWGTWTMQKLSTPHASAIRIAGSGTLVAVLLKGPPRAPMCRPGWFTIPDNPSPNPPHAQGIDSKML